MVRFYSSEKYPITLPEGHRFPIHKYEFVRRQLEHEGEIKPTQVFDSELIEESLIESTHCPDFWHRAKNLQLTDKEIRKIGFPRSPQLVTRSHCSASGTVHAAIAAMEDGFSANFAGGTHHAYYDKAEGFCLLNDIAIAANHLLNRQAVSKVLVIDLDVHQGNGTASIFEGNDTVFTLSVHCEGNYPFKKEQSDLDIGLPAGTGDEAYLNSLEQLIPRIIEQTSPDIVFYQAGVDVLETDKLGKLSLSPKGCYQRDKWVISACYSNKIPLVVVMGGGYSEKYHTIVKAHCSTFKIALESYEKSVFFQG